MTKDRKEQAQYLLAQYIGGKASVAEQELLFRLLNEETDNKEWEELLEELMMVEPEEEKYKNIEWHTEIENILRRSSDSQQDSKVVRMGGGRRKLMVRLAAAVAIFVALFTTAFFLFQKSHQEIARNPQNRPVVNDIVPGGDKAVLTLADGRKIVLDTASNGALVQQGGIKVIKIGGQLSYSSETISTQVLYNTITTPKGGQYQIELADGSKVWLNAVSSLRFPTAFTGKERTVELIGEGYFEVKHNAAMPFHVKVNDVDVQVLGTHFNINSYSDEPAVKTTLLEGRVQVKKNNKHVFLNPGQQAILKPGEDNITIDYDVDVDEVVAWKNGRFLFNSADIETIMRQVGRWYDADVVFEKKSNKKLHADLPRSQNVSQLLKILEATGKVDFEVKGKRIIVTPRE